MRVADYVDSHLSNKITLSDLAAVAGLSRMHFASQFRMATGLRPHEYLVRRRVERAQELLATSGMPLVEVALEVGFKTQAHFTTVFTRVVGKTPKAWQRDNYSGPVGGARPKRAGVTARSASMGVHDRSVSPQL